MNHECSAPKSIDNSFKDGSPSRIEFVICWPPLLLGPALGPAPSWLFIDILLLKIDIFFKYFRSLSMSTIPTQPVSAVVRSTTQVCIFSFLDPCLFLHSADQRPRSSFNKINK